MAPQYAVDGDSTSTRWASAMSDPQWITVDLGSVRTINAVNLRWEAAYAKNYTIQVSDDNATWTTVHTQNTGDGGLDAIALAPVATRYVRMNGTARATTYGYSLYEFEIYGP